jgi:hypothetical protein
VRKQSVAQTSTLAQDDEEIPIPSNPQTVENSAPTVAGWSPSLHSTGEDAHVPVSSPMRSQSNREGSSIPGFEADSALAITRKVRPSYGERALAND